MSVTALHSIDRWRIIFSMGAVDTSDHCAVLTMRGDIMNELLIKSWRGLAVRGAVSLLFGILAALWPGLTLMWLIVLFAAYAIIGGFASISTALQNRKGNSDWWLPLLLGLI